MSTATLVPVAEYLGTTYHPDCDYVDGVLEERKVGQKGHSKLQAEIASWFLQRRKQFKISVMTEQRIRIAPSRYRVPDLVIVNWPEPEESVFTTAPHICIEVLSPDDTLPRLQDRLDDYLEMGVPNVWVLDPGTRRGWRATRAGLLEALDGVMRTEDGSVEMPIRELFWEGGE